MLIARRVRELKVYSEIHPFNVDLSFIRKFRPSGIILSGGPASVYEEGAPSLPEEVLSLGIPVLGICYGMQVLAKLLGGKGGKWTDGKCGIANLRGEGGDPLFLGIEELRHNMTIQVWMSHGDRIVELPKGFTSIARSANSPLAATSNHDKTVYGVQFHPEVAHTPKGKEILSNFLFRVRPLPLVDDALLRGDERPEDPRDGRERERRPRTLRWSGLFRGRRSPSQGAGGSAHLHLHEQRPAAQGGGRRGP